MLSTALEVGVGLLIVGACIVGMHVNFRRRLTRALGASDDGDRERAQTLLQISRDIDKGNAARGGFY